MDKDARLTDTAAGAAHAADLGDWIGTTRVNSRRETALLVPGVLLILICVIGGYFLLTSDAVSTAGRIVFALMGLVFIALGFVMASTGLMYARAGHWLLHRFEQGFVMERTRGASRAVHHDEVTAELFEFTEPGDSTGSAIEHVALRLTFQDGIAVSMAEPLYGHAEALVELGQHCGAGGPSRLEYRPAVEMLARESWQVLDDA